MLAFFNKRQKYAAYIVTEIISDSFLQSIIMEENSFHEAHPQFNCCFNHLLMIILVFLFFYRILDKKRMTYQ